jgi:hypothetical protein
MLPNVVYNLRNLELNKEHWLNLEDEYTFIEEEDNEQSSSSDDNQSSSVSPMNGAQSAGSIGFRRHQSGIDEQLAEEIIQEMRNKKNSVLVNNQGAFGARQSLLTH